MSKTSRHNKNNMVLVKTTAGNTILNLNSDHVCSDVNGKLFLKNARDIQEGELLYFEKEFIDKSLKDIESDLRKSDRYNAAYESLYIDDKPMLAVVLNEGLEAKGITDFNDKVSYIDNLIDGGVTKKTIQNWLIGKTVMVDNKSFLNELSGLAPELRTWAEAFSIDMMVDGELKSVNYDKFKDQIPIEIYTDSNGNEIEVRYGSRYTLYDLYKNIRIGVGHYLAKPKNEGINNKSTTSKTTTDKIALGHEIDIVVKQFFNYVTNDIVSAKVLGITMLDKKEARKQIKGYDHKLKKGVMKLTSGELSDFLQENDLEQITLYDSLNDIKGLEYALAKYAYNILNEGLNIPVKDIFDAYHLVLPLIKESLNSRIIKHYDVTEQQFIDSKYEGVSNRLKKELIYDKNNIFEILMDNISVSFNGIPSLYFDISEYGSDLIAAQKSKISKSELNHTRNTFHRANDSLVKSYGYTFTDPIRKLFLGNKLDDDGRSNDEILLYAAKLTDQDGIDALKKYGLDDLLPIIFDDSSDALASYKGD